jgi:hypothetical protein
MSALGQKADIPLSRFDVRFTPRKQTLLSKLGSFCNSRNRYPKEGQSWSNTFHSAASPAALGLALFLVPLS